MTGLLPNRILHHVETRKCVSYEEEDTCVSYEEEDTCVSYEEEDTCAFMTRKCALMMEYVVTVEGLRLG